MKRTLCAVGLGALCLTWTLPAHAVTGAICISSKLNGSLKMRATGTCKATEIQLGSFDGTTLRFSGINVQVVSGSGATSGTVNGKGNLIVGYNELGLCTGSFIDPTPCNTNADCPAGGTCTTVPKSGSNNLIIGAANSYSSYGGLIAGRQNAISGPFSSVTGGYNNAASGELASVSGGASLSQPARIGWAAGSAGPNVFVGNFESP
jgi:hypothetical protein